jgi:hypothetical protein
MIRHKLCKIEKYVIQILVYPRKKCLGSRASKTLSPVLHGLSNKDYQHIKVKWNLHILLVLLFTTTENQQSIIPQRPSFKSLK